MFLLKKCEILSEKLNKILELEKVLEEGDFATVVKQELSFAEKYPKFKTVFIVAMKSLLSKVNFQVEIF